MVCCAYFSWFHDSVRSHDKNTGKQASQSKKGKLVEPSIETASNIFDISMKLGVWHKPSSGNETVYEQRIHTCF